MRILLLLGCLILGEASAAAGEFDQWIVTPQGAQNGQRRISGPDALWRAIDACGPGSTVSVEAGFYPAGKLGQGAAKPRGTAQAPITVQAFGEVRIRALDYGGGATLAIHGGSWVTFENFIFEASTTGIHFHPNWQGGNVGWTFRECEIDGLWDYTSGISRHPSGLKSKWGILSWSLSRFTWEGGSIHDICYEHAMYHHNPLGDVVVRNATLARVGRTAVQVRCADQDSGMSGLPPGRGSLEIRGCSIVDTGLADGGSSITLAGRNTMRIAIQENEFRTGFQKRLADSWRTRRSKERFGTGAIIVWQERPGWTNGPVRIEGNRFAYAEGAGDREVIKVGSTPSLHLLNNTIEIADVGVPGFHRVAVTISPRNRQDPKTPEHGFSDVGRVRFEGNTIAGEVWIQGRRRSGNPPEAGD